MGKSEETTNKNRKEKQKKKRKKTFYHSTPNNDTLTVSVTTQHSRMLYQQVFRVM